MGDGAEGGGVGEVLDEFGGLGGEVEGFGAGFFEAVEGGVGGFSSFAVGADGFAELFGGGGFVEDVVGDLEGEADGFAVGAKGGRGGSGVRCGEGSDLAGGSNEGGGFAEVDLVESFFGDLLAFAEDVDGFSADEAFGADAFGGDFKDIDDLLCRKRKGGEDFEGEGEEGVSGQQCYGFAELDVAGGESSAEVVVVEGGKVVVDEGEGVDHLERATGVEGGLFVASDGLGGEEDEGGAETLSGSEGGVAHGLVELGGGFGGWGQEFS